MAAKFLQGGPVAIPDNNGRMAPVSQGFQPQDASTAVAGSTAGRLASFFGALSDKAQDVADKVRVTMGTREGDIAGMSDSFRMTDDPSIRGRAFDAAGLRTYAGRLETRVRGDLDAAYQENRNDPAKLAESFDAIRTGYLPNMFPELRGEFEALIDRSTLAYMTDARQIGERNQADADSATLAGILKTKFDAIERISTTLDPDVYAAAVTEEIASLESTMLTYGPKGAFEWNGKQYAADPTRAGAVSISDMQKVLTQVTGLASESRIMAEYRRLATPEEKQAYLDNLVGDALGTGGYTGTASDYEAGVTGIESGGDSDPGLQNRNGSDATGRFQIMPDTYNALVAAHPGQLDPAGIATVEGNKKAFELLTADNRAALTSAFGRAPTDAELYAAHALGAGGAIALRRAIGVNPGMPMDELIRQVFGGGNGPSPEKVLEQNPQFRGERGGYKTVSAMLQWYDDQLRTGRKAAGLPDTLDVGVRGLTDGLSLDQIDRLGDTMRGDLSRLYQVQTGEREGIRAAAADFAEILKGGGTVASGDLTGLQARAIAAGLPDVAGDLGRAQDLNTYTGAIQGMDPVSLATHISSIEQGIADARAAGITTPQIVVEKLGAARGVLDTMNTELGSDPLGYASRAGVVPIQPIQWTAPPPSPAEASGAGFGVPTPNAAVMSMRNRIAQANAVAATYGIAPVFLREEEADGLKRIFEAGDVDAKFAVLTSISQGFGNSAPEVLKQISADAPLYAHLGGLVTSGSSRATVTDALLGDQAIRDGSAKDIVEQERDSRFAAVEATMGAALGPEQSQARAAIVQTADAIYIARAMRGGRTSTFDADMYGRALQEAAGAVFKGDDQWGGFVDFNGQQTLISSKYKADEFDDMVQTIEPQDLAAAAGSMPMDLSGKPLDTPLTEFNMEAVGDNLYAFNYQERGAATPEYLRGDGPGGVFVVDLGAAIEARTTRTRLAEATAAAAIGPRPEIPLNGKTDTGEHIYRPPFMDGKINFGGMQDGRLYQMPDGHITRWAKAIGPGDAVEVLRPSSVVRAGEMPSSGTVTAVSPIDIRRDGMGRDLGPDDALGIIPGSGGNVAWRVPRPAPVRAIDTRPPVAGAVAPRPNPLVDMFKGLRGGGGVIHEDGSITVNIQGQDAASGTLMPDGTIRMEGDPTAQPAIVPPLGAIGGGGSSGGGGGGGGGFGRPTVDTFPLD